MNRRLQTLKYIFGDFIAAVVAWFLFFRFRKLVLEPSKFGYEIPVNYDSNFYYGLIAIPLGWVLLYAASGFYKDVYRKSRLKELGQTITTSILGCTLLFFVFILDDEINTYSDYYLSYLYILTFHFILTYLLRFLITSRTVYRIQNRIIGFNTILIGSSEKAIALQVWLSTKTGRALSAVAIGDIVKRAFLAIGVKGSGHRLRAFYACQLVLRLYNEARSDHGAAWDASQVLLLEAEVLGHNRPETLRPYLNRVLRQEAIGKQ